METDDLLRDDNKGYIYHLQYPLFAQIDEDSFKIRRQLKELGIGYRLSLILSSYNPL